MLHFDFITIPGYGVFNLNNERIILIDTLRINLVDCDIKPNAPIVVQPAVFDHSNNRKVNEFDLFRNNSGRIIRGSKAFLNHDKFNITINPSMITEMDDYRSSFRAKNFKRIAPDKDLWDYNYDGEDDMTGIFLQTSLPRLLSETNIKTLSKEDSKKAIDILNSQLKSVGIKTNLSNANLSRLDTFTNISTDFSFFTYTSLFSLMNCSRMKAIGYGDESYLWKNKQQELMIYDKVKEIKTKRPDAKIRMDKNIMRFENRLLRKRKILSSLRFNTVGEMFNSYDDLKDFHKKEIEKKVFKYSIDEIESMTETELERIFLLFKNYFGKRWFYQCCFFRGLRDITKPIDFDVLFNLINKIEGNEYDNSVKYRMKKSRLLKKVNKVKEVVELIEKNFGFKTNLELYNELRTKFYKQVA